MRILCVCGHGNVRSVSLAYLLKSMFGMDALAVGVKESKADTVLMLSEWADLIITVENKYMELLPKRYRNKVLHFDIGEDVWLEPMHPNLMHRIYKEFKKLQ